MQITVINLETVILMQNLRSTFSTKEYMHFCRTQIYSKFQKELYFANMIIIFAKIRKLKYDSRGISLNSSILNSQNISGYMV